MKLNIIIPMAGKGSRFKKAGYKTAKPLIKVHDKTLLQLSVNSLPIDLATKIIFVALEKQEKELNISKKVYQWYKKFTDKIEFVYISKYTQGQAETVLKAHSKINPDEPLLIFNIDTCFQSKSLVDNLKKNNIDGVIGSFQSTKKRYSFAQTNAKGFVKRLTEKEPISNKALTGLYHFKKAADFFSTGSKHIQKDKKTKGEFYIAPMYNDLIKKGKKFILDTADKCNILGTPEELENFQSSSVSFN